MAKRRWSDLSKRTQRAIVVAGTVEAALKVVALADLRRRPAAEIRGPKWVWIPTVTLVNSVGLAPAAYLLFGRKR